MTHIQEVIAAVEELLAGLKQIAEGGETADGRRTVAGLCYALIEKLDGGSDETKAD